MTYRYALEARDVSRIDKLNGLTDPATFWQDVRQLSRRSTSCHTVNRWQHLAEIRFSELVEEVSA